MLLIAAAITLVAIVGKLISGTLGSRGLTRAERVIVGAAMVPRGEVGIIVASLGLQAGIVGADLFGAVLLMVVLTTLSAPPVLQRLYAREARATDRRALPSA